MLHKYPYPGQMYDSVGAYLQKPHSRNIVAIVDTTIAKRNYVAINITTSLAHHGATAISADTLDIEFDGIDREVRGQLFWQNRLNLRKAKNFMTMVTLKVGVTMHGFTACNLKTPGSAGPSYFMHQTLGNQPIQCTVYSNPVKCTKLLQMF